MVAGVIGVHLRRMEMQMTAPIDLGRARAQALSSTTYRNINGAISRALGWAELQPSPLPWDTRGGVGGYETRGLFVLTDGPAVARFLVFLLHERSVSISSLFHAANATLKVTSSSYQAASVLSSARERSTTLAV